ncbi:Syntaxin-61 [Glycine soja]|uniref:Syntaxin-61 n=1 Tax=Glycine soja TaxID=3848 RepID=A0A0B2P6C7_GLYSO|nr:Syntaxin-61 [Glycine soja]
MRRKLLMTHDESKAFRNSKTRCLRLKIHSTLSSKKFKNLGSVTLRDSSSQIDKLQSTFPQWEKTANAGEQSNLSKKVNGLNKAIFVASRDPSWYGIDGVEVENRRKWTSDAGTRYLYMQNLSEHNKESSASWKGLKQLV